MRTHAKSAALLLALATAGCSLTVDPAKNDPLKTAEGFCNSIQDTAAKLDCGAVATSYVDQVLGRQRANCDTLQAAVDAGRFKYSSSQASACIDALQRIGCRGMDSMSGYFPWPQACSEAIQGNVVEGGECTYQEWATGAQQTVGGYLRECVAGTGCYSPASASCGGICQRPGSLGDNCAGGRPCAAPNVCSVSAGYTCQAGTTGSPCGMSTYDCAAGYQCALGFCEPLPSAGMPCSYFPGCDLASYCDTAVGMCVAKVGAGQPCAGNNNYCQAGLNCWGSICKAPATEGQDCSANVCASGLYCKSSSATCMALPAAPLPQGADCSGLGTAGCEYGLFCDTAGAVGLPWTCQPQRGPGGDCSTNGYEVCRPGTVCYYSSATLPASSTCVSYLALGAPCDVYSTQACEPGLICRIASGTSGTTGTCSAMPGDGESCINGTTSVACAPGTFGTSPPGGGCLCVRIKGEGEPCTSDYDCGYTSSGLRCDAAAGSTCQMKYTCEVPIGWLPNNGFGGYY